MAPLNLKGKTALITGASAGIGLEFAVQLHRAGAHVVLVARREESLKDHCNKLNDQRPHSARYLVADISDEEGLNSIVRFIEENEIEVLINNAGRGSFGYFEQIDFSGEAQMVRLNVLAPMRLTHAVLPQMKRRKSGALITISSIAAFQPLPYMATYAATKAFELSHSLALRHEVAPFNIRVLSVCPGPVDTEFAGVARIPGKLTGAGRDSARDVVSESLEALFAHKSYVVPCVRAKLMWFLVSLLPRSVSTYLTGRSLKSTLDVVAK